MNGLSMKYFVLKPGGNDAYGHASRKAMIAYADAIAETNPDLALDLVDWVNRVETALLRAEGREAS